MRKKSDVDLIHSFALSSTLPAASNSPIDEVEELPFLLEQDGELSFCTTSLPPQPLPLPWRETPLTFRGHASLLLLVLIPLLPPSPTTQPIETSKTAPHNELLRWTSKRSSPNSPTPPLPNKLILPTPLRLPLLPRKPIHHATTHLAPLLRQLSFHLNLLRHLQICVVL